jgi:hypothetical protein
VRTLDNGDKDLNKNEVFSFFLKIYWLKYNKKKKNKTRPY